MSIDKQKQVAKYVLEKLKFLDCYAILAGGACRDWYLGKEATDLDFYLYYNPLYKQSLLQSKLSELLGVSLDVVGSRGDIENTTEEHRYTCDPEIELVLGGLKGEVPIQIIIRNKPFCDVGRFCFDICQAYSTEGETVKTTKKFDEAVKHKVIRITGEFYMQKESYMKKIKSKFPDYLHIGF